MVFWSSEIISRFAILLLSLTSDVRRQMSDVTYVFEKKIIPEKIPLPKIETK
ncbi:hypothetical protein [Methanorbis rubei]|uniref:Uncharacterized protein n=1 Tax=Methanorbis rubei TaxID=3028300 RepID=A0AAE4MG22_9EURY|nr:hypothetical protein [Methanocorpusculaceae archaeon Cs1]